MSINGRARLKWAASKIYKMTKMTGNPFHCTATLKPAPHLEPINYDRWAELEFKHELTWAEMKVLKHLKKIPLPQQTARNRGSGMNKTSPSSLRVFLVTTIPIPVLNSFMNSFTPRISSGCS